MNGIQAKRDRLLPLIHATAGGWLPRITVADAMTPEPAAIGVDSTAYDLAMMFRAKRFRHLLVTDSLGRLAGVVSDRDVIGLISPVDPPTSEALADIPTSTLMSTDLITAGPQMLLADAARLMIEHGINCLPVVEHEAVAGIITSTDLKLLLQLLLEPALWSPPSQPELSSVAG